MNPKISIIVPVYKVEPYIHKCIDSILNQTFKDFELILIDDGSPDNCGKICDEYALKDNRVLVIHKENGGLSSARNRGIDIAKGEYIGFVDSDDWIEPDMYEILYDICKLNDCDMANCSSTIYFPNKTVVNGGHSLIIHNKEEAMKTMLEGKLYDEVAWTKLIKKELLSNIRFKEGIIYEDTDFTYRVIDKANKIGCIGKAKYNYMKREGSTMDKAVRDLRIDAAIIYEEMYEFFKIKYPSLSNIVLLKLANSCMSILNMISKDDNFKYNKEKYYKVAYILNKHYKRIFKIKEFPNTVKILLSATKINPILYRYIINKV